MRVIGVLDLRGGRAVHARGGAREAYPPVGAAAGVSIDGGDALALARVYLGTLGVRELYAADLDAIAGEPPQRELIAGLATLGAPLWVDAGVADRRGAGALAALGVAQVVVGLETLATFDELAAVCAAVGGARVAFSLDVRAGMPLGAPVHGGAVEIAARAAEAGAESVIVLDLARVGSRRGPDLDLIGQVRAAAPAVTLVAGGGVRDASDLESLAGVGCDGALVATALQDGRLGAAHLARAAGLAGPLRAAEPEG